MGSVFQTAIEPDTPDQPAARESLYRVRPGRVPRDPALEAFGTPNPFAPAGSTSGQFDLFVKNGMNEIFDEPLAAYTGVLRDRPGEASA